MDAAISAAQEALDARKAAEVNRQALDDEIAAARQAIAHERASDASPRPYFLGCGTKAPGGRLLGPSHVEEPEPRAVRSEPARIGRLAMRARPYWNVRCRPESIDVTSIAPARAVRPAGPDAVSTSAIEKVFSQSP